MPDLAKPKTGKSKININKINDARKKGLDSLRNNCVIFKIK